MRKKLRMNDSSVMIIETPYVSRFPEIALVPG
jgi:hypothetical protein